MSNFSEVSNINFELSESKTWGLEKGKFDGYSLPVMLDEETANTISNIAKEHEIKSPIYGRGKNQKNPGTLYLKLKNISDKQKAELLDKGKANILVHFSLTGVFTNKEEKKFLVFKTIRLRRIDDDEDETPMD